MQKTVALFDLDGVVFNTEPLYSGFWKRIFNHYYPEAVDLEMKIKGQTLHEIYSTYFTQREEDQRSISQALAEFEQNMPFIYIEGFKDFLCDLKDNGMKTAVVTSSNREKMNQVYLQHSNFKSLFDKVLTSEDFEYSKPHPDPYLKGADYFHVSPSTCIGFEDSFNGLKSVKAAQMTVVGLSTSNPQSAIAPYCDVVIPHYAGLTYHHLMALLSNHS